MNSKQRSWSVVGEPEEPLKGNSSQQYGVVWALSPGAFRSRTLLLPKQLGGMKSGHTGSFTKISPV